MVFIIPTDNYKSQPITLNNIKSLLLMVEGIFVFNHIGT